MGIQLGIMKVTLDRDSFESGHRRLFSNLQIGAFIISSLLALCLLGFGFLRNEAATAELARSKGHTSDLIRLQTALLNAETGQRGFLLTGEDQYLEPFETGTKELEVALNAALAEKHYSDVFPRENAAQIKSIVDEKVAELRETIRLYRTGDVEAAIAIVKTDQGKRLMDRLRLLLDAELSSERSRELIASKGVDRANWIILGAGIFLSTLIGGMLAYIALTVDRVRRTEFAEAAAETAEADEEYVRNIAHELNHRLKNMFSVTSGMLRQTARGESDDVKKYADEAVKRLHSMGVAYFMTDELGQPRDMAFSELIGSVVQTQILPHHKFDVSGTDFVLAEDKVTPFAMILHELTTNALKFGAWKDYESSAALIEAVNEGNLSAGIAGSSTIIEFPASADTPPELPRTPNPGHVSLTFTLTADGTFELTWAEQVHSGPVSPPVRSGYGSKLVKICAKQVGAEIRHDWNDRGLSFSLKAGDEKKIVAA